MASRADQKGDTPAQRVAQLSAHLAAPGSEPAPVNSRPALPINYPASKLKIDANHCIDDVRELKVAVVGAGLSGINAGILLPAKVPGIKLTIFEKNADVSGTWLENAYPGGSQILLTLSRSNNR
jgi:hypothetical protein